MEPSLGLGWPCGCRVLVLPQTPVCAGLSALPGTSGGCQHHVVTGCLPGPRQVRCCPFVQCLLPLALLPPTASHQLNRDNAPC